MIRRNATQHGAETLTHTSYSLVATSWTNLIRSMQRVPKTNLLARLARQRRGKRCELKKGIHALDESEKFSSFAAQF